MLKIEVIRFEAEDVITASVETPVEKPEEVKCICSGTNDYNYHKANGSHSPCPATEHPNCVPIS